MRQNCDGQIDGSSTANRRQIDGKIDGSSTAYRHPLKLIFQKKMDLGVRLGVLLGFARWRRRLVPSLDFDHFCCVSWFWQLGRAPKLGRSQKSQNQKILYAPVRGKKTAGRFCFPQKESFVSRAAAGSLDSEREREAQGVGPRNILDECIFDYGACRPTMNQSSSRCRVF